MDILLGGSLTANNDIKLTTDYPSAVAQRLTTRFKTFTNEWMLDLNYGVDWFNKVLGKGRSKTAVDAIIRQQILLEDQVESIIDFKSTLIGRQYSVVFKVKAVSLNQIVTLKLLLNQNGALITTETGLALLV